MCKKLLFILALTLLLFLGTASASIDDISYPYNNEILNSATIDLNFSRTGSASCYWNYNNGHNYTISCGADKIRLPKTDGNYTLTISDNTFSQKSVNVILDQPDGFVIVFFSIAFIIVIISLVTFLIMALLKAIALQMSIGDLAYNWGAFFGLLAIYLLSLEYLGNPTIISFLKGIMEVGGITNFMIPSILFIVVEFKNRVSGREEDYKK